MVLQPPFVPAPLAGELPSPAIGKPAEVPQLTSPNTYILSVTWRVKIVEVSGNVGCMQDLNAM